MSEPSADAAAIPLLWINLDRAPRRRARMEWAIREGGWQTQRLSAIDAQDSYQRLLPIANPLRPGTPLPGLRRSAEPTPWRRTSRPELACLASWKQLLLLAEATTSKSGWVLLMEDDLGASLAAPNAWAHNLLQLIKSCPTKTLAIQLAPISAQARRELHHHWLASQGQCLSLPKEHVRSHGNGAVLVRQEAIPRLIHPLERRVSRRWAHWHPLIHPWWIRPVADKWLYGALPLGSCRVATYPHFCLEAEDSSLHSEHVDSYHLPSRRATLETWHLDNRKALLAAQQHWDTIS